MIKQEYWSTSKTIKIGGYWFRYWLFKTGNYYYCELTHNKQIVAYTGITTKTKALIAIHKRIKRFLSGEPFSSIAEQVG